MSKHVVISTEERISDLIQPTIECVQEGRDMVVCTVFEGIEDNRPYAPAAEIRVKHNGLEVTAKYQTLVLDGNKSLEKRERLIGGLLPNKGIEFEW
jgi:hypothetical protein